jgi:site-specific DNA-methyltransferase (adenine-specific)/adenine-specific DNA-methyltransferase
VDDTYDDDVPSFEATDAAETELLPHALTDEQIEEIATLLRAGRRLPPHLFPHLFEAPREYHLAYRGKARAIDIVADTMAVPLQPVRTFGESADGWSDMLVFGDNLQVLRQLINLKEQGRLRNPDGTDGIRVCYIDPPFASQQEFAGNRSEKAYLDNVAGAEFVEHLRRRLVLIREVLSDDGSLFVHLDTRKVHYIKVILDEIFGEGFFRNEIVWKRTGAHSGARRFAPVHDVLLFYTKSSNYKWKERYDPLPQETIDEWYNNVEPGTNRLFNRQVLTGRGTRTGQSGQPWRGIDPGAKGRHWSIPSLVSDLVTGLSTHEALDKLDAVGRMHWPNKPGGVPMLKWYLDEAKGIPALDIITDIARLSSTSAERVGYPTQKPAELVQRLIAATSDGGDIVLDAFLGSGTTAVAAQTLPEPRRWIGIDSGKFAIYVTQATLLKLERNKGPFAPFTLYNAGLYDYRTLRELSRDQYVDFVLQLFQCRKHPHTVAGVEFQGYIGDDPVLVYDFKKHPRARIGAEFVDDLAGVCGGRLGQRCFIIAPATAVEPYEDYLTVGETRFFFLRIPYSIIAELHKKAFSDLRQPTSEARTNELIDSVGFDFIQPPNVDCRYIADGKYLRVEILAFESEAFAATPSEQNIADLAMILVDYAYDGEVFALSAAHFGEDLAHDGWGFCIPRDKVGAQVMLIYVDLYGNEHREVRSIESFQAPISGVSPVPTAPRKTSRGSVSSASRTLKSRSGTGQQNSRKVNGRDRQ